MSKLQNTLDVMYSLISEIDQDHFIKKLSHELRELTGVEAILLIGCRNLQAKDCHILSESPPDTHRSFTSEDLKKLCPVCSPKTIPRPSDPEFDAHPLAPTLIENKIKSVIRIPLHTQSNSGRSGSLLLINPPETQDEKELEKSIELLKPFLCMTLKNIFSQQEIREQNVHLDALIQTRTEELEKANQSLNDARLAALNMMEDAMLDKQRLEMTQFALDHSADAVFWVDRDGSLFYTNEAASRQLGYSSQELTRLFVWDIVPEFSPTTWDKHWKQVQQHQSMTFESRHRHKEGQTFPVEIHVNFMQYANRQYICAFVHNITNRKKAEQALKESEEHLRTTLQSIGDAVISTDLEGRIKTMNPIAESLTGYSLQSALGLPLEDVCRMIHEKNRAPAANPVSKILKTGNIVTLPSHILLITKDGREIPIADSGAPIRDAAGNITGIVLVFRDQTRERNALKALEESESRYRTLFENMTSGFSINQIVRNDEGTPIDYLVLKVNPSFERMIGIPAEQIVGKSISKAFPEQNAYLLETFGRAVKSKSPICFERYSTELNKYFEVRLFLSEKDQLAVVITDITERRVSENQLRELNGIQNLILNNSTLGIALVRHRSFEWINQRLSDLFGIPPSDMQGAQTRIIYPTEEAFLQIGQQCYPILAEGLRYDGTLQFQRADGSLFWCRLIGKAIDPKNPDDGSLWMFEDISEQKESEIELMLLSTAIEQSPETVLITDPEGHIQYANPAFETVTGYTRHEVIGKTPDLLRSGQHSDSFYKELWKTIQTGKTWSGRFINRRKDGTLYSEDATISPVMDDTGRITHFVAVKRDITEELAREEQFHQSQKMEAVGQLAGGIAHDFNNILQAILGFSELLLLTFEDGTIEYRNVNEIHRSATRAAGLTKQLLAFSRKQPANRTEMDLNTAVRDTEVLLDVLLGEKNTLVFNLDEHLPLVCADHGQITQIIMNLAVNSRDAMPSGGRLTISTDTAEFTAKDVATIPEAIPGTFACLSIEDTGFGMTEEVKDRLFEPFFTTKGVGKGTGLGLSVVYGIIKQNKGWISVQSEVGQGTAFHVYLPLSKTIEKKSHKKKPRKGSSGEHILIVEDDTKVCDTIVEILEMAGYKISVAHRLKDAVKIFEEKDRHFDLLLTDIVLQEDSGIELANELRKRKPDLPILLYSGYLEQKERWKNSTTASSYHFTQKPFTVAGLLAAVHQAISDPV